MGKYSDKLREALEKERTATEQGSFTTYDTEITKEPFFQPESIVTYETEITKEHISHTDESFTTYETEIPRGSFFHAATGERYAPEEVDSWYLDLADSITQCCNHCLHHFEGVECAVGYYREDGGYNTPRVCDGFSLNAKTVAEEMLRKGRVTVNAPQLTKEPTGKTVTYPSMVTIEEVLALPKVRCDMCAHLQRRYCTGFEHEWRLFGNTFERPKYVTDQDGNRTKTGKKERFTLPPNEEVPPSRCVMYEHWKAKM